MPRCGADGERPDDEQQQELHIEPTCHGMADIADDDDEQGK